MRHLNFIAIIASIAFTTLAIAESKPTKDRIGDLPLQWEVDLYHELKTNFPKLEKEPVYFIEVTNHRVSFQNNKKGRKDSDNYRSTNNKITVRATNATTEKSFIPKATPAKAGDTVILDYNQQIKVYVPSADKFVWIRPKKDGIKISPVTEPSPADAALAKSIQSGQIHVTAPATQPAAPQAVPAGTNN